MAILPPTLETARLLLRPFGVEDAPAVQVLASAREIAATTLNVPHPYEAGMAESWIEGQPVLWESGRAATFALTLREGGELVGSMGLRIEQQHERAELGYWIGVPFWGRGYATEAGQAILRFGFEVLHLSRIFSCHLASNPASGRVQEKIGMQYEGCLREHYVKWGERHDAVFRGILASEWNAEKNWF